MEKITKLLVKLIPFKSRTKRFLHKYLKIQPYPIKINCLMRKEHIESWLHYKDAGNLTKKIEFLKKGLDDKSKLYIDLFLDDVDFFTRFSDIGDKIYFIPQDFISDKKLEGMTNIDRKPYLKKYKNKFSLNIFEPSVIFFHCGLTLLDKKVSDYIKGKDFIDGGAFIGDSAFVFEDYEPKTIHAFEPVEETRLLMEKTIKMNSIRNIKPVALGLSNSQDSKEITRNVYCPGCSSCVSNTDGEKRMIETTTIDKYVEQNNLNLGLIKLDVEGLESDIISQSLEAIRKFRPILLISIYHNPRDFFEIKPFLEKQNLNYKFMVRDLGNDCIFLESMLIGYPAELGE